jgi:retron-type reverse transcriptase
MKIYKDLHWSIISPKSLFRAWEIFKSDKRNKPDVAEFELHIEQNIFDLYRDLKNETYRHGPYKGFWIHDPKLRRIHKAVVRDRVLHHATFAVLNKIFEPTFIDDSFSCRIDKGTHKGVEKVVNMLRATSRNNTRPCYALKCDVRKFFDSVDHEVLKNILIKKIKDQKTISLLEEVIESYRMCGTLRESKTLSLFTTNSKGVPIGNLTSQIFANIYMNEFDQFVKHGLRVKNYARYTDDFMIISEDRKYLEELLPKLQDFLRERLKLELHPNKISIRKFNEGIDFLGYVIFPHYRLLRAKTKKRVLRNIRKKMLYYQRGLIPENNLHQSMQSYLGVLSHANTYELTEDLKNQYWYWLKD